MARVNIKHACGHTETKVVRGDDATRVATIAWMEKTPCRRCYAEELRQRKQDEEKEAIQLSIRLGFPVPTGEEKDVREAILIRQRLYETVCRTIRVEEHRDIRRILAKEKSARFWIERRRDPPRMVINTILARNPDIETEY